MGLLDGYPGLGAGGNIDLNQLVRPPDPLGAALGEISQRLAVAGQASRLPTSTLGAIGSALGGASTAANTAQTQYLDQAIKLQGLKRSLQQMGLADAAATRYAQILLAEDQRQRAAGATPAAAPAVPGVLPGAAPVAPIATAAAPGVPAAAAPAPVGGGFGGGDQGSAARAQLTSLLGAPGGGLLADPGGTTDPVTGGDLLIPSAGGAGAATTPNPFRLASLVGPAGAGDGSGAGSDPLGLITKYESGGRNIRQQVVPESESSASGPWQMLDSTFHETAKKAGIDTSKYDSAKDAPIETQRAVAQALYNEKGFAPWANYNPKLAAAIGGGTPTGGTASPVSALRGLLAGSDGGGNDPLSGLLALAGGGGDKGGADEDPLAGLLKPQDEVIPSGGGLPAGLMQKAALGAGNAGYPIPNILPPGGNAAFPPLPATSDNQIPIEGPGAPDTVIRGDLPADAQQVGDRLIGGPSTRRPGMMMAQYAPGGAAAGGPPAGSGAAAVANALSGAPPLVGPGSGVIPGLGMTPAQAVALSGLAKLGGVDLGLQGMLELYYKSPEYLRGAAEAQNLGQRAVTEPSDIRIAQQKAVEDRTTNYLKTIGDARFALAPNGILVPDGQGGMKRVQATVEQAVKAANGLPVPELGIAGMYSDTKGGTTPGGQPTRPQGPIAGEQVQTPAQAARDKAAQADFDTNVAAPFQAGQKALFPLTQIETAMQNYQTGGPTPETELGIKRALNFFADRLGLPADSALRPDPNSVASGEIIRKSGNALGFELARSLGAHEAENVVNQAIQSNPGLSVSPTGNTTLIALIKQGIQRDFDKHAFYNQWFDRRLPGAPGGTYVGADDAFNELHPVESYVSQVLPYKANTKVEADKLPPGTRFIGPDNNVHIRGAD